MSCRRNINSAVNGINRNPLFKIGSNSYAARNTVFLAVISSYMKNFVKISIRYVSVIAYVKARCAGLFIRQIKHCPTIGDRLRIRLNPLIFKTADFIGILHRCRNRKSFQILNGEVCDNGRFFIKTKLNKRNTYIAFIALCILESESGGDTLFIADFCSVFGIHFKVHIENTFCRNGKFRFTLACTDCSRYGKSARNIIGCS